MHIFLLDIDIIAEDGHYVERIILRKSRRYDV